jgi:hypothetical protein
LPINKPILASLNKMLSKHSADAGFGQFVNILEWVCFRQDLSLSPKPASLNLGDSG